MASERSGRDTKGHSCSIRKPGKDKDNGGPWLRRKMPAIIVLAMQAELDALESKLSQILERYQGMGKENLRLRQQVVALENANKQLSERLSEARTRMESLLNKIPD